MRDTIPVKFNFKSARSPDPRRLPAAVSAIVGACEKLSDGDLVDIIEVAKLANRSDAIVSHFALHPAIVPFRHKVKQRVYYGNRATIVEFKKSAP